jgi:hypothetical protein
MEESDQGGAYPSRRVERQNRKKTKKKLKASTEMQLSPKNRRSKQ